MKGHFVALATLALAGCNYIDGWTTDPAIRACEFAVRQALKTPSTYQRISAAIDARSVSLSFDSQNSYGALIRSRAKCNFWKRRGDYSGQVTPEMREAMERDPFEMTSLFLEGQRLDEVAFTLVQAKLAAEGLHRLPGDSTQLEP
jgi:hypothetical protein